jgi:hypothetical protein
VAAQDESAASIAKPQQPPASIGYDVAQVRHERIAVLYTLLNGVHGPAVAEFDRE